MTPLGIGIRLGRTTLALAIGMSLACNPPSVWADGGRVEFSKTSGSYRVTLFSTPAPLAVGSVDLSVLIQDEASGTILHDLAVNVILQHDTLPLVLQHQATQAQATNRLLHSAKFQLPEPGVWHITIRVGSPVDATFELAVHAGSPMVPNSPLVLLAGSPFIGFVLFLLREQIRTQRVNKVTPKKIPSGTP